MSGLAIARAEMLLRIWLLDYALTEILLKIVLDVGGTTWKITSIEPSLSLMYFLMVAMRAAAAACVFLVVVISEIITVPNP
jgi:hypothetical protein